MKIDALTRPAVSAPAAPVEPAGDTDERTRDRVAREVLAQGPVTAAALAGTLGLTAAAVRRHLDVLLESGVVAVWEAPDGRRRGRGRPARRFVLTDAGHAAMTTGYDDLASQALRFLGEVAGDDAVRRFAQERIAGLERRYAPAVEAAGQEPQARAEALAAALSVDGYAASAREVQVGDVSVGTQLCQGHCPVQHVAREFPQLCEAETEAFSRLLGVHVQRLATLAHGAHVCTTHVPPAAPASAVPAGAEGSAAAHGSPQVHPDDHHERTAR